MLVYTLKDISREIQLSVRTTRRWLKRLDVAPSIPGHATNRWTAADMRRFLRLWAIHTQAKLRKARHHETN